MNHFQTEERSIQSRDRALNNIERLREHDFTLSPIRSHVLTPSPVDPKPPAKSTTPDSSPYLKSVEQDCEDCAGSGKDIGELDPWAGEPCAHCQGTGKEMILRNYFQEACAIVRDPESKRPVEREHLCALLQYTRESIGSLNLFLPEVA